MMRRIACLVLAIFLIVFESALFSFFPIEFSKPDLVVPLVIYGTFFLGPLEGLVTAVFLGFGQELLSAGPAGSMLFTKIAVFLAGTFLRTRLFIESRYTFALLSTGFVILQSALFLTLGLVAKGELRNIYNVSINAVPAGVFTGMLSLPLFTLLEQFKIRLPERT